MLRRVQTWGYERYQTRMSVLCSRTWGYRRVNGHLLLVPQGGRQRQRTICVYVGHVNGYCNGASYKMGVITLASIRWSQRTIGIARFRLIGTMFSTDRHRGCTIFQRVFDGLHMMVSTQSYAIAAAGGRGISSFSTFSNLSGFVNV